MILFDSHAHAQFEAYARDRGEVIRRSAEEGVWMMNVGTKRDTSEAAVALAEAYPSGIFAAVGLHPAHLYAHVHHDAMESKTAGEQFFDYDVYRMLATRSKKVVAIGETGLDYYRLEAGSAEEEREIKTRQAEVFLLHLKLAEEIGKPMSVHCRDAHDDLLALLEARHAHEPLKTQGVIHSFSGSAAQAMRYRALGFKIAFNGIITFAREYDEVVTHTPLEDILIETDCPYLTPAPHRGKRNEPIYVKFVAQKIAEIKETSYETVARQTAENAKGFLKIE